MLNRVGQIFSTQFFLFDALWRFIVAGAFNGNPNEQFYSTIRSQVLSPLNTKLHLGNELCSAFITALLKDDQEVLKEIIGHEIKRAANNFEFVSSWTNDDEDETAKITLAAQLELIELCGTNINLFIGDTPLNCNLSTIEDAITNNNVGSTPFGPCLRSTIQTTVQTRHQDFTTTWETEFSTGVFSGPIFLNSAEQRLFSQYYSDQQFTQELAFEVDRARAYIELIFIFTQQFDIDRSGLVFTDKQMEDCYNVTNPNQCLRDELKLNTNGAFGTFNTRYRQILNEMKQEPLFNPNITDYFFLNEFRKNALNSCIVDNTPGDEAIIQCTEEYLKDPNTIDTSFFTERRGYVAQAQNVFNTVLERSDVPSLQDFIDNDLVKFIPNNLTLEQHLFLTCFRLTKLENDQIAQCIQNQFDQLLKARNSLDLLYQAIFDDEVARFKLEPDFIFTIAPTIKTICQDKVSVKDIQQCIRFEIRKQITADLFKTLYQEITTSKKIELNSSLLVFPPFFQDYVRKSCQNNNLTVDQETTMRQCIQDLINAYVLLLTNKTYFKFGFIYCFYIFIPLSILFIILSFLYCFLYVPRYVQNAFLLGVILFILTAVSFIVMGLSIKDYTKVYNTFQ